MRGNMKYYKMFINEAQRNGEYKVEEVENGALLIPKPEKQFVVPNIIINDINEFDKAIEYYINVIRNTDHGSFWITERHNIDHFLFYLIRGLTNSESQDLTAYVYKYCDYLENDIFDEFKKGIKIGSVNEGEFDVIAKRQESFYGEETAYAMSFSFTNKGINYKLPIVRYGIDTDNNCAYIYSVQRKKLYDNNYSRFKHINEIFNKANKGIREDRDITPSMLCSLTLFMGMLKNKGVKNICADGFLTRRYTTIQGAENDEDRDKVYNNSVDKFFKLFRRIDAQFEGIEITAFPQTLDSFLHMEIGDEVKCDNELLNSLFKMGESYIENNEENII